MTNSIRLSAAFVLALSLVATAVSAPTWQRASLDGIELDARRIGQPVLVVMGAVSRQVSPVWQRRQDALTASLSDAEPFVLDGATHMLHLQNPRGLAELLAAFFADHPLK